MYKLSVGWKNAEEFSEDQTKSFKDKDEAFTFCRKHINTGKIIRINGTRFFRDFEEEKKEVSDAEIWDAINEGMP